MVKRFFNFLYGDIPARFPSDFPLMASVERLRGRTKRTVFSALFRQAAVGPVTESRVRLQRVIPLFGNSFKPIFVGRFEHSQGRVVLNGRFTMFLFSKIFMTAWLAFALVWTTIAAAAALQAVGPNAAKLQKDPMPLFFPLIGVLFFFGGVALVRGCWWLSRRDMTFLTAVIQAALRDGASNSVMERTR
jgi:hypothetical protein